MKVTFGAPLGNFDHSSTVAMSMAQTVLNLCIGRKFFSETPILLDYSLWATGDLPRQSISFSDNPVEVLYELHSLLIGRFIPIKVIRVYNKDKPWFKDDCWHAFDLKQVARIWWTRES